MLPYLVLKAVKVMKLSRVGRGNEHVRAHDRPISEWARPDAWEKINPLGHAIHDSPLYSRGRGNGCEALVKCLKATVTV